MDGGFILFLLEHTKWCSEGEIANDVECEVVEPIESIDTGIACWGILALLRKPRPLLEEEFQIGMDVLLELTN